MLFAGAERAQIVESLSLCGYLLKVCAKLVNEWLIDGLDELERCCYGYLDAAGYR